MIQRFTIPGRLDGLNEYIAAAHSPWKRTKLKERNEGIVIAAAEHAGIVPVIGPARIDMTFYERPLKGQRARDVDNVCGAGAKFIMDALKSAGYIADDDCRHVPEEHTHGFYANEGRQRIVVEIASEGDQGRWPTSETT